MNRDIEGERVVGLVPNGYSWVVAQWAVWVRSSRPSFEFAELTSRLLV